MHVDIVSLFPEMVESVFTYGINRRVIDQQLMSVEYHNPRDFTENAYKNVDDRPYGGGPGMVMMAEPLFKTLNHIDKKRKKSQNYSSKVIYLSPQGKRINHQAVVDFSQLSHCTLICGRYEGVDERFLNAANVEEWSIGDYVLSGGELAAMVLLDAVIRQLPGVLGNELSKEQDSFANGLLDCPHYTRPEVLNAELIAACCNAELDDTLFKVPDVLLGGNHKAIDDWRLKQSLGRTWLRRKDLLDERELTNQEKDLLAAFKKEYKG